MTSFFRNRVFRRGLVLAGALSIAPQLLAAEHVPSPTRWVLNAGYGLRLWDEGGVTDEQRRYEEKAKRGLLLGGDVAVFPLENFGLGMSYYRFQSSTTDDDLAFYDGARGKSTDTYLIEYVGPALYYKRDFSRFIGLVQAGAGVIYYDNQHEARDFPGVLQDAVPGFFGSLGADYKLASWFGVGLTARILYGKTNNLVYNGAPSGLSPISLTRIDMAGGIRFYP
jgi:hypothetical protein